MSTREQNPDHQADALTRAGVDAGRIHIDMASGKLASRPNLDELMGLLEPGDQVEFDREAIVEGTLDGLAAARARGRVGGRRAKLTQRQLDQAQQMYDSGQHTVAEMAATFHVSRATMNRYLAAELKTWCA